MKIVVLLGGDSPERDVSLNSGKNIITALRENGHDVIEFDPGLSLSQITGALNLSQQSKNLIKSLADYPGFYTNFHLLKFIECDLVFNSLHGGKGENGVVQTLLETLDIKYTGSQSVSCMLTMDKELSKRLLSDIGLPVANALYLKHKNDKIPALDSLEWPLIVKPADGGSSLGHTVLQNERGIQDAVNIAFQFGNKVMIEEYINGKEIAAGVLSGEPLPLVHIKPKHGIYDYECKYTAGMSQYEVPAELDDDLTVNIQSNAVKAYNLFGCSGYARIDFLVNENNSMVILEANTLPGMTATSLLPKAAKAAGYSFNQLVEKIVQDAVKSYET